MNQTTKQMIVMLYSVAFIGIVAIIVLSSSAAATTAAEIERDNMESIRDSNLDRAERVLSGDYYEAPTHTTPSTYRQPATPHTYFNDDPIVHDNRHEIERLEDELETLRHEAATSDRYDTDFSDRVTDGIYALIVVIIIIIALCAIFGWIEEKTSYSYKPDTPDTYIDMSDTSSADEYDRRAAQAEIEKEWK